MRLRYILGVLGLFLWVGCYEEDDIVPREEGEMAYSLPQGNHDYDVEILQYFEDYGFYPLYIFDERDLYWNNTDWIGAIDQAGLIGACADTVYVGKIWDMCKNLFFNHYPGELLEDMPMKFLMCSRLDYRQYNKRTYEYDTVNRHAYSGYDYLAVNYGGKTIDTLSRRQKMYFQQTLNTLFLQREYDRGKFEIPEAFSSVCDYVYTYLSQSTGNYFGLGYVRWDVLVNNNKEESISNDFRSFLELAATPLELLEDEPQPIGDYYSDYYVNMDGVLNEDRDTSGKIRQKYEILMDYLKDCGIDTERLQYPGI